MCYIHNIFTTNHRWLVVISSNLNLTLRLLFYSNNNNQLLRICCKNVVKMFLPFIKKFVLPLLPKMISVILERYINNEERYRTHYQQNPCLLYQLKFLSICKIKQRKKGKLT